MVERLIAAGHPEPWHYTPRQAVAFDELAHQRRARERLEAIEDGLLSSDGVKPEHRKRALERLRRQAGGPRVEELDGGGRVVVLD